MANFRCKTRISSLGFRFLLEGLSEDWKTYPLTFFYRTATAPLKPHFEILGVRPSASSVCAYRSRACDNGEYGKVRAPPARTSFKLHVLGREVSRHKLCLRWPSSCSVHPLRDSLLPLHGPRDCDERVFLLVV